MSGGLPYRALLPDRDNHRRPLRRITTVLGCVLAVLCHLAVPCDVEGVVLDEAGLPIGGARVSVRERAARTETDSSGHFRLSDLSCPVLLHVAAASRLSTQVEVPAGHESVLEIILIDQPSLREEIVVTERSAGVNPVPPGAAVATVSVHSAEGPPPSAAEMVTAVPGVALNGQGGRSQGASIRGISRHRIFTSVSGVRVTGERRAGVSADFLDPFLIDRIGVIRGPSSAYRGSGALGGIIEIVPRRFSTWQIHSEFRSQGRETALAGGWGNGIYSIGFSGRGAGNSTTPIGKPVNDHFRSFSTSFSGEWNDEDRSYQFSIISSLGSEIGKAAGDFPETVTTYPLERHLLAGFRSAAPTGWQYAAGVHAQTLHTRTQEDTSTGDVYTDSWDLDLRTSRPIAFGSEWVGEIGIDYFGRRSVDSRERASVGGAWLRALEGGLEDNLGLFASLGRDFRAVHLQGGTRLSLLRQVNSGYEAATASSGDAFVGVVVPVIEGLDVNLAAGTGLRFPSLSERFYSGLTGRGTIIGNPRLDRERSHGFEGGLMWSRPRFFVSGRLFGTRIRHYVERIELEPDLYSYANLVGRTIQGLEVEAVAQPGERWLISVRGHSISGDSVTSGPLADIPVDRLTFGISHQDRRWQGGLLTQLRDSKRKPGSGESPIPGVVLITPYLRLFSEKGLEFSLALTNLLDRTYLETADKKTDFAPGRSVVLGLSWRPSE